MRPAIFNELDIDTTQISTHSYIAIKSSIGIGKTTLPTQLTETTNKETPLENGEENPFPEHFYPDRCSSALPSRLLFLFQHIRKLNDRMQGELVKQVRLSDFLIEENPLFTRTTLDDDEYRLYRAVCDKIIEDLPGNNLGGVTGHHHYNPHPVQ